MNKLDKIGTGNVPPSPKQTKIVVAEDINKVIDKVNEMIDVSGIAQRYAIILNQPGADVPVATVLADTITGITIARTAAGTFTFTKIGGFPVGKSIPNTVDSFVDENGDKYVLTPTSADVYTLTTFDSADLVNPADGILVNRFLLIEIYN